MVASSPSTIPYWCSHQIILNLFRTTSTTTTTPTSTTTSTPTSSTSTTKRPLERCQLRWRTSKHATSLTFLLTAARRTTPLVSQGLCKSLN